MFGASKYILVDMKKKTCFFEKKDYYIFNQLKLCLMHGAVST